MKSDRLDVSAAISSGKRSRGDGLAAAASEKRSRRRQGWNVRFECSAVLACDLSFAEGNNNSAHFGSRFCKLTTLTVCKFYSVTEGSLVVPLEAGKLVFLSDNYFPNQHREGNVKGKKKNIDKRFARSSLDLE